MTNLDSILKSRDITLPTKVHLVNAMVFPVVMYGCESWTVSHNLINSLSPTGFPLIWINSDTNHLELEKTLQVKSKDIFLKTAPT